MIALCFLQLICIYLTHEFSRELEVALNRPLDCVLKFRGKRLSNKIEAIIAMQAIVFCVSVIATYYYVEI